MLATTVSHAIHADLHTSWTAPFWQPQITDDFNSSAETVGSQVVDFFAMNKDTAKDGYLREVMSMHHSHDSIGKLIPIPGDVMVTSRRKPILKVIEDTGPGVHDTLVAACDHHLYEQELGIKPEVGCA